MKPVPDGPPSYDSVESMDSNESRPAPPIQRNSNSSVLRGKPSKKSVAYKPSQAQQAQIDLLDKTDVTALTAISSHSQTEYFDVLPSFQMFQSILKRDNAQFDENLVVCPPVYGDVTTTSPNPPSLNTVSSHDSNSSLGQSNSQTISHPTSIDDMLNQVNSRVEEYNLMNNEDDDLIRITDEIVHEHNRNVEITEHSYGYSPLDKIDKLPTSRSSPLDIQIYVTKKVPQPNMKNDLETRLKEYSSGDLVNGYIIITNTSDKPVDFGLFTVSLEGTIKATEPNTQLEHADTHRYNRILMKKFLKMYDFNASYGYTLVPNSSGIEYVAFSEDLNDGTRLGLPTDRILAPLTKYKKFFTFKFPSKLLDNSCPDSLLPHILPPPSMGLDTTCFYNMGSNIELNKALGYGFLNLRGTPLLTRDYSLENVSISYTIEAKFINKVVDHKDHHKQPFTHDNINDPNSDQNYEISKSNQFFLRFIPDLKHQMEYYNQSFNFETYGSIGIDGKLMQQYTSLVTWRSINEHNYAIEKEIDDLLSKQGLSLTELKQKNLFTSNNEVTNKVIQRLNIKDQIHNQLHREYDEIFVYQQQRMLGNKLATDIYGKKKKSFLSSTVKLGKLNLYVKIPDKVISYGAPRLLQRYNDHSTGNSGNSSLDLTPIASNMSDLYNRDEDDLIQSLDMDLLFSPNEAGIKPPPIANIDINVVVWTYSTESPIPFEIGYDFLYTNVDEDDKLTDNAVEITRTNLQNLKDRAYNYLSFLQANDIEISKKSFLYLSSIKTLGIKKDTIQEYFASYSSPILNKESSWILDSSSKELKWRQKISIPIKSINKNNVNLLPTFQSCMVGRMYCLQVVVKYKGHSEGHDNEVKVDIPILIG